MTVDAGATESRLDGGQVVDGDDPRQPAATCVRPRLDGLAERGLVRGRVVQRSDDLEVDAIGQRQHEVAGAEARVQATVTEAGTQRLPQSLGARTDAFGAGGVGQVVESHVSTISLPTSRGSGRVPS